MRENRGFTLIELMVGIAIVAIVAGMVVWQGRSARRNATMAQAAYELALRIGGLKARAMADGQEYVLVVADTSNPAACKLNEDTCGQVLVLTKPDLTFATTFQSGFVPGAPVTNAEVTDDGGDARIARNAQFDLGSTWRPPAPFSAVTAFDPNATFTCAGRSCFAIRFRPDGQVLPIIVPNTPIPAGYAFVLRPIDEPSGGAERRAIFVSFPAGLVKTAAF